jgi:hypothetical protein
MQLLFEGSEENGGFEGLGIIPGQVTKFDESLVGGSCTGSQRRGGSMGCWRARSTPPLAASADQLSGGRLADVAAA